ncbi:MAG TPA: putative peptide modification system cyclase [Rhodanobacteraceae bacterium]|nr:putative peptide modification system cyclase [Rhodanobacteraceae bacterium]
MSAVLNTPAAVRDAPAPMLRTLVLCDLADSTALVERLGDLQAAELFRKHDRLTRTLVHQYGGREIDKTDGFLMMFDRPIEAVAFALAYQRALHHLAHKGAELRARVGIHFGDVIAWDNTPDDIAKGAKPFEIEGLVKPITSRLMQLALPGQILLSGVAYQLAHRGQDELGDAAATAVWRTHGRYRFKGLPDPVAVFEVGEKDVAPLKAPPWSGKAYREVPFWRRPATIVVEAIVLLALVAIPAWYLVRPEPAIAFAQRDWVVVGNLRNLTDDTSFDDSLETAFRLGLEQSRYVNVLSDLKTRKTLELMERDPEVTKVDRAIGSEVALRDGARALILPTIAEIGGRVRVTAEVIDPHTQTAVWSESADGVGPQSVLPSLDKVNQKLRVRLGEALATVSSESQPLDKVATKNLDALRAFSLGIRAYNTGHRKEAIALYEQALKLDPDFARAHVELLRTYITGDQEKLAREEGRKAAALRDRMSSRDALYIDAWQATFGPQLTALEKWKAFATVYPDFFTAPGTYGYFAWLYANDFDEAISEVSKAASPQNPNRAISDYLLGFLYVGEEKYAEAMVSFKTATAGGAMSRNEYYAMAYAAQREFDKADETLGEGHASDVASEDVDLNITKLAITADRGRWDAALGEFKPALAEASKIGPLKARRFRTMELGLTSLSAPRAEQAAALRGYFDDVSGALKNTDDPNHVDATFQALATAYLAARLGDDGLVASVLASDLPEARDGQYFAPKQMLAVAEAERARAGGNADRAISILKPLVDGRELCIVHQALLDAYASGGHTGDALKEANWLAAHRGRAYAENNLQRMLTPLNVVQSDLALLTGAELAAKLNRTDEAKQQLDAFRKAWPNADRIGFVAARTKTLDAALAKTPAHAAGSN